MHNYAIGLGTLALINAAIAQSKKEAVAQRAEKNNRGEYPISNKEY